MNDVVTATTWTITRAAILALTGSVVWAAPGGGTARSDMLALAPVSVPASPYPAEGPNPLNPPGCWDVDGIWHPDCWGPGQWGPGQYGPGQWGPGMMGPGQWGPGTGPGMMGPGQWGY
ncbi:conserved exported hypothetical protein [uncultured Mycobacterium sp.]|uniref:Uncharacterized protein n=1 Tax=uncultured Mycobacterium sp. TaxID=171292 RepID=A0A1Y5PJF7_9MYCO|nr:conserved exported hypothetical protein [uncultured Mycobacterium sp.]